jgi:hypothetical protein
VELTPRSAACDVPRRNGPVVRYVVRPGVAITLWSLQALSAASWIRSFQYADDDTGAAGRLARGCLEHGACAATGTPAAGFGLAHGASWIRLIRYCLASGGGLATVQVIVLVLLIAATIVSSIVTWQALSWRAGMFASLLVLPATMATLRFDDLTNGTLLPLPLALYYACTVWFVQSERTLAMLGASLALAAAVSAALMCIVIVPFHIAVVALVARTPLSAATSAALVVALAFAIESPTAAAQLARLLVRPALLVLGLLFATGLVAATRERWRILLRAIAAWAERWRRRFLDVPAAVRSRIAMTLAAMYLLTVAWIGPTIAGGFRIPDAHFFAAAVFPLVFLAADATHAMSDRAAASLIGVLVLALLSLLFAPFAVELGSILTMLIGAVSFFFFLAHVVRSRGGLFRDLAARPSARVAIAGAMFVFLMSVPDALIYPRTRQLWPVATAETTVRGLYGFGFTFPELMGALQGQAPYTIQSMIASLDPDLFGDPPRPGDVTSSLLAMIVDPATAARTQDVLMRVKTPAGDSAIVVHSTSVLDRAHLRTCYAGSCAEPIDPQWCTARDPDGIMNHQVPYFPVDKVEAPPPGATYCIRFFIPLRMSGTGEPHWLRVPQLWPLDIRIRQVGGVSFDGALPGPEVRLRNDRAGDGALEVEVSAHGIGPGSDWLEQPPLIEVTAANEHLLEPFRHGRVMLR